MGEYAYDAFNRRIAKRVAREQFDKATGKLVKRTVATAFFVWDGDVLLQEIDGGNAKTTTYVCEPESFVPLARMESDEAEETYAKGTVYFPHVGDWDMPSVRNLAQAHVRAWERAQGEQAHAHTRGMRGRQVDAQAGKDRRHFYQCDHLGTPLELFDRDGNAVWAAKYKAWGGIWEMEVAQVSQPLRFQGQYLADSSIKCNTKFNNSTLILLVMPHPRTRALPQPPHCRGQRLRKKREAKQWSVHSQFVEKATLYCVKSIPVGCDCWLKAKRVLHLVFESAL